MLQHSETEGLESILALNKFLENVDEKKLTKEESERIIKDNLVVIANIGSEKEKREDGSVVVTPKTLSCGLLITTNGFILTASHSLLNYEREWEGLLEEPPTFGKHHALPEGRNGRYVVVTQDRTAYPIDMTCYRKIPKFDIAIIKAMIPQKPEPIKFRVVKDELVEGEEVKVLGLKGQEFYSSSGIVTLGTNNPETYLGELDDKMTIYDTFLTHIHVEGQLGLSGAPIINSEGELAGLTSYLNMYKEDAGFIGGAKFRNISKMIEDFLTVFVETYFNLKADISYNGD